MAYREQSSQRVVVSGGRSVSALDLATGGLYWINSDFGPAAGGALLVTEDRVYVAGWHQAGAIDATSGRTVWQTESNVYGRPALLREGDHLLIAGSGMVECLSIDGRILWRAEVPKGNSMSIALGDRV